MNIWVRVREAEFANWSLLIALLWDGLGETDRGLWREQYKFASKQPLPFSFQFCPIPSSTLWSGMERDEGWGQGPEVTRAR